MAKGGLSEEVTMKLRSEWQKGAFQARSSILGPGTGSCYSLQEYHSLLCFLFVYLENNSCLPLISSKLLCRLRLFHSSSNILFSDKLFFFNNFSQILWASETLGSTSVLVFILLYYILSSYVGLLKKACSSRYPWSLAYAWLLVSAP